MTAISLTATWCKLPCTSLAQNELESLNITTSKSLETLSQDSEMRNIDGWLAVESQIAHEQSQDMHDQSSAVGVVR